MNDTKNWFKSGDYDIKTAQAMCEGKRYVYVIFMCHLSIEKYLKAFVVKKSQKYPPRTHDLLTLCRLTSLKFTSAHLQLIARLNAVSVPTRYPEDISQLVKSYNRSVAQKYLKQTQEFLKWLRQEFN